MPVPLWRTVVFGKPFETRHAQHARLPNWMALPVFASDALSSVSYATEEILLVLATAGASAVILSKAGPIGIWIALVLAVVILSYRQTVRAYPQGGGDYRVARENLGLVPGLTVASALLLDYILTVAVSISAGVAAITSAMPQLADNTAPIAVGFIVMIALINLRGAKESGLVFAIPTYAFVGSILAMLAIGFSRLLMGHDLTAPEPPAGSWTTTAESLSTFLILKAFTSGCTALTGIEAVTDGVPAFKPPEAQNAARVLAALGVILVTLFVGITMLAQQIGVVPFPAHMQGQEHRHTVVSQIARAVFGDNPFYYVVQAATALILILAANTAFVDFPRLSSYLAVDRFFPGQMANVGDRLVFSNGIIGLALFSALTVVLFQANTHNLIPLYAFGVFLAFTLGQMGMLVRWFRFKAPGWQLGALISGTGAVATGIVLVIIAVTKFAGGEAVSIPLITSPLGLTLIFAAGSYLIISPRMPRFGTALAILAPLALVAAVLGFGAQPLEALPIRLGCWIVMVGIAIITWLCLTINQHYREVAEHLSMGSFTEPPKFRHTVLLLAPGVHRGLMPAVAYARGLAKDVRGVYVEIDPSRTAGVMERWQKFVPDIPLVVLESPYRGLNQPILEYIDEVERERDDDVITVILPEFVTPEWWTKLLHNQNGLLLKWALLWKKGVVVTNIRYYLTPEDEPAEIHPLQSYPPRQAGPAPVDTRNGSEAAAISEPAETKPETG